MANADMSASVKEMSAIVTAMIRDGGEAASHQAKERIGREMLASFGSNNGHGKPHHENITIVHSQGVFSHRCLRKASAADPVITGLEGSAGIAARAPGPL